MYMLFKNNKLKLVKIISICHPITKEDEVGGTCLRLAWATEPISKQNKQTKTKMEMYLSW